MTIEEYLKKNLDPRGYIVTEKAKKELNEYIESNAYYSRNVSPYHTGRNGRSFDVDGVVSFIRINNFTDLTIVQMVNNEFRLIYPALVDGICAAEESVGMSRTPDVYQVKFARLIDRCKQYNPNFKESMDVRVNNKPDHYRYYLNVSHDNKLCYMAKQNEEYDRLHNMSIQLNLFDSAVEVDSHNVDPFGVVQSDNQLEENSASEIFAIRDHFKTDNEKDFQLFKDIFENSRNDFTNKYNVGEIYHEEDPVYEFSDVVSEKTLKESKKNLSVFSTEYYKFVTSILGHSQMLSDQKQLSVFLKSVSDFKIYMIKTFSLAELALFYSNSKILKLQYMVFMNKLILDVGEFDAMLLPLSLDAVNTLTKNGVSALFQDKTLLSFIRNQIFDTEEK